MVFYQIGLHKPDFDETWADLLQMTRRFPAAYSHHKIKNLIQNKDMFDKNNGFLMKIRLFGKTANGKLSNTICFEKRVSEKQCRARYIPNICLIIISRYIWKFTFCGGFL